MSAGLLSVATADSTSDLGGRFDYVPMGGGPLNGPATTWWYGCSPTAAGMLMGYYDQRGYGNLVPGLLTGSQTQIDAFLRPIIASEGHQQDFYGAAVDPSRLNSGGATAALGYGSSGDDLAVPAHTFDSLADFMGTSQDAYQNPDGTTGWYAATTPNSSGVKVPSADLLHPSDLQGRVDGLSGLTKYLTYRGYSVDDQGTYTQWTDARAAGGFSLTDFKEEIDAGRPVILHLLSSSSGHDVLGIGYDSANEVEFYDTWDDAMHVMSWTGTFSSQNYKINLATTLDLNSPNAGVASNIPESGSAVALLLASWAGLAGFRRVAPRRPKTS